MRIDAPYLIEPKPGLSSILSGRVDNDLVELSSKRCFGTRTTASR
jgi:hypothetical protein